MNETRALADFLSELTFNQLPAEAVETAKLCILDAVGVALSSRTRPWAQTTAQVVAESGSSDVSSIWGQSVGGSPEEAALVNGTAVHGIEMDDRMPRGRVHPGCYTIPPAIALGEKLACPGRDVLLGIVAGYELGIRVGLAVRFIPGFAQSGHKGVWSSVAASAKVLGLDAQQTADAYGIAGSMASGLYEFTQDPRGTMVKRLHGGLGARSGVLAAALAQQRLTGPNSILEGKYGYLHVLSVGSQEPRIGELTAGLGERFRILDREIKPYAAWGGGHLAIDAVHQLVSKNPVDVNRIATVRVAGSRSLVVGHELRRPESVMAAQYSLAFLTAVSLCRGADTLIDPGTIWVDSTLSDPQLLELAARVELGIDADLDESSNAEGHYGGARVTVRMNDGETFEAVVLHSKGTVENPMSADEIRAKFERLVDGLLPEGHAKRIEAAVDSFDTSSDVRELGRLLRVPV
jgi:2-methylcitrate dehydratase PrpD